MPAKNNISAQVHNLALSIARRPDLTVLGNSITGLPPVHWKSRMFFCNMADTDFRRHTGSFPATLRRDKKTHPLFVLRATGTGHLVCPCSSRPRQPSRFISKGCVLEMGTLVMDRNSYLVEQHSFTLPLDSRFSNKLFFQGRVPRHCIKGETGQ